MFNKHYLSDGVLVVDVPPPRVEVLVVDVELVVAGASGFVPRVHDDARLHERRHRLLKGRQVLLLELVRQVALYFAVKGRSKKWARGCVNFHYGKSNPVYTITQPQARLFLTIPVNDGGLRPRPVLHDGVDDHVGDRRLLGDNLLRDQKIKIQDLLFGSL